MKQILWMIGMSMLLVGCTEIRPLDTRIEVIGNPLSFHTEFEKGNNTINITIKQQPSKLIYFPEDYGLIGTDPEFQLRCFDRDYDEWAFTVNLTKLWYTTDYIEKRIDENTVLKFAELRYFSEFDPYYDLNYSFRNFDCRIESEFGLPYLEYIDGVLVQNYTNHCGWFWEDWRYDNIKIYCDFEDCEYRFSDSSGLRTFMESPDWYIMDRCYIDWTIN